LFIEKTEPHSHEKVEGALRFFEIFIFRSEFFFDFLVCARPCTSENAPSSLEGPQNPLAHTVWRLKMGLATSKLHEERALEVGNVVHTDLKFCA
jgi:hypothetical protein